jgi:nitrite reductase/ring-hydroxylating ferredoxin subunit
MVLRIEEGSSDLGPEPLHVSTSAYTDPARFEAERRHIFGKTPLLAGMSRELPEPGSILLFDAAGPSIFIVRTKDGSLNAFLNMCPHRGARLVNDTRCRLSFVCPFHAWRFDADGELLQRPLKEAFISSNDNPRLVRVPVAEKHGLIFVRCQAGTDEIDIDAFLGPILPLIRSFDLAGASLIKSDQLSAETNWKLAVDISCEGYHVPATHPTTLHPYLVPFLTIHDSFGLHHRFCGPSRHLEQCLGKPESEWPKSNYSAVHYIYPNTVLTYTDAIDGSVPVLAVNRSFPGKSIGEALVQYTTYKPSRASQAENEGFVKLHDAVFNINRTEDIPTVTRIWKNYANLPNPGRLVFGRNEMVLQKYHFDIGQAIGMPLE